MSLQEMFAKESAARLEMHKKELELQRQEQDRRLELQRKEQEERAALQKLEFDKRNEFQLIEMEQRKKEMAMLTAAGIANPARSLFTTKHHYQVPTFGDSDNDLDKHLVEFAHYCRVASPGWR